MASDGVIRLLADSKYDSDRIRDDRGMALFYHRGEDVTLQLGLSVAGTFALSTQVGTIWVAIKADDAEEATPPLFERTYSQADCDPIFNGEKDWKAKDRQLLQVTLERGAISFPVGTYRMIVVHDDTNGLRKVHAETQFEVRSARWENPSVTTPPTPTTEYYTKDEIDNLISILSRFSEVDFELIYTNTNGDALNLSL